MPQSSQESLSVRLKKPGLKDKIKTHAASRGESVQAFVLRAIKETMYHDTHCYMLDGEIEDEDEFRLKYLSGRG